jgi:hypothetical protein
VAIAKRMGISVIQKKSTASAFEFLESHPNLKKATSTEFRIITDAYREDDRGKAGKYFIKR